MKLKFVILLICCTVCTYMSFAQERKESVYFLKKSGDKVDLIDSADYIRVVSEPDSGSKFYNVSEYYAKTKTPKFSGKTSKIDPLVLEGQCVDYYPSGKKQEMATYNGGNKEGEDYQYYKNGKIYLHKKYMPGKEPLIIDCIDSTGKVVVTDGNGYFKAFDSDFKYVTAEGEIKDGLKNGKWKGGFEDIKLTFTEDYTEGKLIAGQSVDANGITNQYTKQEIQPQFPGGVQAFGQYLGATIKYPYTAMINHTQGKVLVSFVVEKDGSLSDVKVRQSPSTTLSGEAVRVVQNSPNWTPGYQYGRKVRVSYVVPINFALNK